ncbi:hypothetical protein ACZ87_00828 [Candidatus Erwinia dacicola]|uniref:Uncharacterized protein n=1 Tax=Candidatus Erwinia dacicola TaxID=252393 RepID=A0A328TTF1_9GAMM|nr:hypothetical protein ACZ87_00828 [Candidatus Erwinia dacicola]
MLHQLNAAAAFNNDGESFYQKSWQDVLEHASAPRSSGTKNQPKLGFSLHFTGCLFSAGDAETLVEAVNTTTGSNITLLASVERVAVTTHVQVQVVTHGRASFDFVTARTFSSNFSVIRVNTFFHGKTSVKAVSLSRARIAPAPAPHED